MRSGNTAAVSATCATGQPVMFTRAEGKHFLEFANQGAFDRARLHSPKVIVRGQTAVVTGMAPEPVGAVAMKVVKEGGK